MPAWTLLARLRDRAAPGLAASGDSELVDALLEEVRTEGTGAARQRAAHLRHGRLGRVVDSLVVAVAAG
ncbi:hypothetical protein [Streptomyces sp. NBC_01264]|uniref:hypothetical protein n=1 Tax=Streptomyces sp. NBC_01264 TaxID=2903804 RepID=UPI00224E202B|nr:hypothetical protein [Streptomyces sp. NBC_01264]MCX4775929.1 hypothetical protein [Streptomyces sp. NBC_01264]